MHIPILALENFMSNFGIVPCVRPSVVPPQRRQILAATRGERAELEEAGHFYLITRQAHPRLQDGTAPELITETWNTNEYQCAATTRI